MSKTAKKINTRRMTQLAILIAIEVVLGFTPLGFIMVPPISMTTMHLPVLIAAIVLGPLEGGILGFSFGTISMIRATTAVGATDMLFSPFVSGEPISSIIMTFVPRILMGVIAGYLYIAVKKLTKKGSIALVVGITVGKLSSTFMVLFCLWSFFDHIPMKKVFTAILSLNGTIELALGLLVVTAVCQPLLKMLGKDKTPVKV